MTDATEPRGSRPVVPVLLALMVLAQFGIANEIRYQGCVARYFDAVAKAADEDPNLVVDYGCSRIPLL